MKGTSTRWAFILCLSFIGLGLAYMILIGALGR